MTQRDALEAGWRHLTFQEGIPGEAPEWADNLPLNRERFAEAIAAYLAALPPGDEAGLVNEAYAAQETFPEINLMNYSEFEVERLNNWGIETYDTLGKVAAALEAKGATIARLQADNAYRMGCMDRQASEVARLQGEVAEREKNVTVLNAWLNNKDTEIAELEARAEANWERGERYCRNASNWAVECGEANKRATTEKARADKAEALLREAYEYIDPDQHPEICDKISAALPESAPKAPESGAKETGNG